MVLARPELLDARPWGARLPAHTSIVLDPLSAGESRELVAASSPSRSPPPPRSTGRRSVGRKSALRRGALRRIVRGRSWGWAPGDGHRGDRLPPRRAAALRARRALLSRGRGTHVLAWCRRCALRRPARRRCARRAGASRPRAARASQSSRRRRGVPLPACADSRRAYSTLPRAERAARHRDVARTSRSAPPPIPVRSPGFSVTTGARRASPRAPCRIS